jgi:transposase InsO family protein
MLQAPNIIKYHNRYWARLQYVVDECGVSEVRVVNQSYREDSELYRSVKLNQNTYIDIETVPKKHLLGNDLFFEKCHVLVWDSNIDALHKALHNEMYYKMELQNADWYHYHSGLRINYEKAKAIDQYGNILLIARNFPYKNFNIKNQQEFFEHICIVGSEVCPEFKFKSWKSIYSKLQHMPFDAEQLKMWLIPGSYKNQNSRKWGRQENKLVSKSTGEVLNFDTHEALVYRYWINPGKSSKLSKKQVYDHYKTDCVKANITPVSLATVKRYINLKRPMLSLERDGFDTFNSKYSPYVMNAPLEFSGSQWCADYSGSKLAYWNTDRDGEKRMKSLNVLRIIDVMSGKIVGWQTVKQGENPTATLQGFKNAVEGVNYAAIELVTDNGSAFKAKDIKLRLSKLFVKHRYIGLGNKQANPAEGFVKRLTEYSRELDNWMMLGFAASFGSENNRNNEDYASQFVLENEYQANEQIELLFERWNEELDMKTKRTRSEIFEANRNPKLQELSQESRFFAFANHSRINIAECRGNVMLQLGYESFNYQFKDYAQALATLESTADTADMNVIVAFDHTQAHIYSPQGDFIMSLEKVKLSHKSFAEMTAESKLNLEKQLSIKANFKTDAQKLLLQTLEAIEALQEEEPLPYLLEVKVNHRGKKRQEEQTETRIIQTQNNHVAHVSEEMTEEEERAMIREHMLNQM